MKNKAFLEVLSFLLTRCNKIDFGPFLEWKISTRMFGRSPLS